MIDVLLAESIYELLETSFVALLSIDVQYAKIEVSNASCWRVLALYTFLS